MIEVREANLKDFARARQSLHEVFEQEEECFGMAPMYLAAGPAYTLEKGGEILIIGGLLPIWNGVMSAWAITTRELAKYPVEVTRKVRRLIEENAARYNLHRLEITVRADFLTGARWAQALGFQAEGILRRYGMDKKDYLIFGRIF